MPFSVTPAVRRDCHISASQEEVLANLGGGWQRSVHFALDDTPSQHGHPVANVVAPAGIETVSAGSSSDSDDEEFHVVGFTQEPVEWSSPPSSCTYGDEAKENVKLVMDESYNAAFESDRSQSRDHHSNELVQHTEPEDVTSRPELDGEPIMELASGVQPKAQMDDEGTGAMHSRPSMSDGETGVLHSQPLMEDGETGVLHSQPIMEDGETGVLHSQPIMEDGETGVLHSQPIMEDGETGVLHSQPIMEDGETGVLHSQPLMEDGETGVVHSQPLMGDGETGAMQFQPLTQQMGDGVTGETEDQGAMEDTCKSQPKLQKISETQLPSASTHCWIPTTAATVNHTPCIVVDLMSAQPITQPAYETQPSESPMEMLTMPLRSRPYFVEPDGQIQREQSIDKVVVANHLSPRGKSADDSRTTQGAPQSSVAAAPNIEQGDDLAQCVKSRTDETDIECNSNKFKRTANFEELNGQEKQPRVEGSTSRVQKCSKTVMDVVRSRPTRTFSPLDEDDCNILRILMRAGVSFPPLVHKKHSL